MAARLSSYISGVILVWGPGCCHSLDDVMHRTTVVGVISGGTRECPGIIPFTRVGVRGAVQVKVAWTRAGAGCGKRGGAIPGHGVSGDLAVWVGWVNGDMYGTVLRIGVCIASVAPIGIPAGNIGV